MAPRVALVHDFLLDLRGAERVFAAICDTWPEADVFTAVYDAEGTEGRFAHRRPRTSFLQRVRPTARTFRPLLPLYPHAIESLDLRGYDIVVSSRSEEHTSELQSRLQLVCRLPLEKKKPRCASPPRSSPPVSPATCCRKRRPR